MVRKICVVVGSRANYSSIKSVMQAIKDHPDLELQVVAGASALLDRYGMVSKVLETDGFKINARVYMIIEGETPATMAKSTGLGLVELPTVFEILKPDVVITVGDRFETMATAISAAYMDIPLAHTMGGEVSGTIDESVRHAVTKLAHIHFPASDEARERIIRLGEDPSTVYMVGCPRIDLVGEIARNNEKLSDQKWLEAEGVGGDFNLDDPFLVVSQHPVTSEYRQGERQITETLIAINELKMPTIMLWPNADAGSEDVARGMRKFREHHTHDYIRFYKNFPVEIFVRLMMDCACMIGNSSAAIRESAYLGVPAVNVGTRQNGRQRGSNVIDVGYDNNEILRSIQTQIRHGRYPSEEIYGDGHTGSRIAQILATCKLTTQKMLTY